MLINNATIERKSWSGISGRATGGEAPEVGEEGPEEDLYGAIIVPELKDDPRIAEIEGLPAGKNWLYTGLTEREINMIKKSNYY